MLPLQHRLRLEKDIKTLLSKGKSVFGLYVGVKFRPNRLSVSRFAIVVGTKVAKRAVVRNRLRRQLRGILFRHLGDLTAGYDVMLIVKKNAIGKTSRDLETELLQTFMRKSPLLK
jgi:ribonuclease P protein component